jgi:hypothetical protein
MENAYNLTECVGFNPIVRVDYKVICRVLCGVLAWDVLFAPLTDNKEAADFAVYVGLGVG